MIEIQHERPQNSEHFAKLLAFCGEIMAICRDLGIAPILSGSLAVFGYTRNPAMRVNDIDLACSEPEFARIIRALDTKDIAYKLKEWHVLQAHRDELKVEFDSIEYWMSDLPDEYDKLVIGAHSFTVVGLSSLIELYRRGLEDGASQQNTTNLAKYAAIEEKYAALSVLKE